MVCVSCVRACGRQIIPPTVFYRQSVEQFTNFRLNVVKENSSVRPRTGLSCVFGWRQGVERWCPVHCVRC
jgi:hypothetical protein